MEEIAVIFEGDKDYNQMIDELEAKLIQYDLVDCPLSHVFTPGLYVRSIFMPAGSLIISMIHKERHQYIVSKGIAHVQINAGQWEKIEAPYAGITESGTRRVLYIEKDCIWSTVHAVKVMPEGDSEEDVAEAVMANFDDLYVKRINPLLGGMMINNVLTKLIEQ